MTGTPEVQIAGCTPAPGTPYAYVGCPSTTQNYHDWNLSNTGALVAAIAIILLVAWSLAGYKERREDL